MGEERLLFFRKFFVFQFRFRFVKKVIVIIRRELFFHRLEERSVERRDCNKEGIFSNLYFRSSAAGTESRLVGKESEMSTADQRLTQSRQGGWISTMPATYLDLTSRSSAIPSCPTTIYEELI